MRRSRTGERVGVPLLDRSQYRVRPTEAGQAFHLRATAVLEQASMLNAFSDQLSRGEESDLRVIVGDLTPTADTLRRLKRFFHAWPRTRLHLHFEALSGPWERLLAEEADLIVHHVDKADTRFEWVNLAPVALVPIAAPGYLPFPVTRELTAEQMKGCVQVIIRDSAKQEGRDYFVIKEHRAGRWRISTPRKS